MREFKDKIVRLRKSRNCDWCDRVLLAGTQARYMVGLCEGNFVAAYYCLKCDKELHAGTCYEKIDAGGWEMF